MSSDGTIEEQIPFIRFNSLGIVLSFEIEPSVGKLVAWCTRSRRRVLMLTRKWISVSGTTEDAPVTKLRVK
jgi:hypothetical protein